jgi:hypothetical protein
MKASTKNLYLVLLLMFSTAVFNTIFAQGKEWDKTYTFPKKISSGHQIIQMKDSSYWVSVYIDSAITSIFGSDALVKFDKNGNKLIEKQNFAHYIHQMQTTINNEILVTYLKNDSIFLAKIDNNGKILWENNIEFTKTLYYTQYELPNQQIVTMNANSGFRMYDKDGKILLKKQNSKFLSEAFIRGVTDTSFYVAGIENANLVEHEYDFNFNFIKKKGILPFYQPPLLSNFQVAKLSDGSYAGISFNADFSDIHLVKSKNGKISATPLHIQLEFFNYTQRVLLKVDKNDNLLVLTTEIDENFTSPVLDYAVISVYDQNGNIKSKEKFKAPKGYSLFTDIIPTLDGYYATCGVNNYLETNFDISTGDLRIAKTKVQGLNSLISGKIAIEDITNCKLDTTERKLSGWLVKSEDDKKQKSYAASDADGNYSILVASGKNKITLQAPSPYIKQVCDSVVQAQNGVNINLDLLAKTTVNCPYMTVDLSTRGLRPCLEAVLIVKYCNNGTSTAQNAFVKIQLDPNLTFDKSSIAGILQADGSYSFALGNVDFNKCGTFTVTCKVKCDLTLLGKTLCNKVNIFPDSLCTGNDSPKIQVTSKCTNGKIDFLIKNSGKKDMPDDKQYFVIEDMVMYKQGVFKLNQNATFPISFTASPGKTYRLVAQQTNLNFGTIASAALEACNSTVNNSTGFVNQFALGDESPFEDEDCRVVTSSFDPNDKQAVPTGVGASHFIAKNTPIDYMIRFQNSGTDTAFTVAIRDTLSAFLDPSSIVPGASSHNYRFSIGEKGVVTFVFDKINLPHEKVNKEGSNGFVKFTIRQNLNNPNGTVIKNNAAIYFDFNAPIFTNTTFHTVGENFISVISSDKTPQSNPLNIKIYPNPFEENARIEIAENDYKDLIFSVLDLNGRTIRSERFEGNNLDFKRENLSQGFYIYQITSHEKMIQSGKIIIAK